MKMARTLVLCSVPCADALGVLDLTGNCFSSVFSAISGGGAVGFKFCASFPFEDKFILLGSWIFVFLEVSPCAAIAALTL